MKKLKHILGKVKRILKKIVDLRHKRNGFSWDGISSWSYGRKNDLKSSNGISKSEKKKMHKQGYYSWHLAQKGFSADAPKTCISDRDYAYLQPYNSIYAKFVNDAITFGKILYDDPHLLKYYYQFIKRNNETLILPLWDLPGDYALTFDDVFRLLREKKQLLLAPSRDKNASWYVLKYIEGEYFCNGLFFTESSLQKLIENYRSFYQLMEFPDQYPEHEKISGGNLNRLRLIVFNEHGDDPVIGDARMVWRNRDAKNIYTNVDLETGDFQNSYRETTNWVYEYKNHPDTNREITGNIPFWADLKKDVTDTALHLREAEYYSIDILIAPAGFYYLSFNAYPRLPKEHVPGKALQEYFVRKLDFKRSQPKIKFNFSSLYYRILNRFFCEPGFARYYATDWTQSVIHDFFTHKGPTIREKLWCYKRGFLSFRKAQYGLNEDNWRNIISDYDYRWLAPINNSFDNWIDDKITYRYVMEPLKQYAPKYYYHLIKRNGELCIIPMKDCPKGYGADMDGILKLIRDEGKLALKQSSGAHGDGFFKLSYENDVYCINNEPSSQEAIEELLGNLSCFYALTEFLTMDAELRKIYAKTVNTIRVMAFNRHGNDPKIMHTYMRIGSSSTGLTDNVGYGGLFCKVDSETGRYYEAESLNNHIIVPCPVHPDSGVLVEGYVPHWDEVRKAITSICRSLPQLEYIGFDVAVTDQGVKILEMNKHQDLHRSHLYGDEIQNFFKEKIEQKRQRVRKSRSKS